ncbi:SDR family oxidoreductase [Psychrobacillus sp. NPDC096426]|uniref:SDR family oxidoreductase n=1 Tax=Psychrobacillus sp. NPDC096426 TaxID=3364491 RepID=UPI003819B51B
MTKTALITGSSRGIGRATALELAKQGYDIIVHYKKNESLAKQVLEEVRELGADGLTIAADLENTDEIRAMVNEIRSKIGHLDALVLNAAATAFKPLNDLKEHNMDRTFNLTIKGALVAVQEATPLMSGRSGKIVTVSGFDSIKYVKFHGMLGAVKASLESLTRYWACELANHGINVNSVNPGAIETDSSRTYAGDNWESWNKEWLAATPKGRMGTPQDIAGVIAFLCSPESEFICGQTIVVDGGITLTAPPYYS